MARSISMGSGKGDVRSDLMHNTRVYIADNVDREMIKYDVILKRQTLTSAYGDCFGAAQKEYNSKQKRKDRKINDYFTHLFGVSADDPEFTQKTRNPLKNKNKNQSYYENILQIGDRDDTGRKSNPQAAKLAKQALIAYVNGDPRLGIKSYAERNPNFYVFDAVVHMDESTPHLHLCYIPVATDYKKGMSVQHSHDMALKQMGYKRHTDYVEQEREVFRKICKSYGLDPKAREAEQSRGHTYSVKEYKEKATQIRKSDAERIKGLMPAVAPTEPATAPTMSYRSHKQSGKKAPVEAPTKPVEHTGFTRFNYSEAKQKIRDEMQREREQQAEALYSEGNENDIEADIEV